MSLGKQNKMPESASASTDPTLLLLDTHVTVWLREGSNRLKGFRADTGAVVFAGGGPAEAMSQVRRFQAPIVIGRHLYVAADQQVYAFMF